MQVRAYGCVDGGRVSRDAAPFDCQMIPPVSPRRALNPPYGIRMNVGVPNGPKTSPRRAVTGGYENDRSAENSTISGFPAQAGSLADRRFRAENPYLRAIGRCPNTPDVMLSTRVIPALKKDTVTLIDDRDPHRDSEHLQLSNFSLLWTLAILVPRIPRKGRERAETQATRPS